MKKIIFVIVISINLFMYSSCRFDEDGCDVKPECNTFERCYLGGSKMTQKTYAIPALEGGFMVCHATENDEIYLLKTDENGQEENSPFSPLLTGGLINDIIGEVGGIIQFPQDRSYMICVNQGKTIHLINIKQNGNTGTRKNLMNLTGGEDCKCNSLTLSDHDDKAFIIGGQARNSGNYGLDTYIIRGTLTGTTISLEEPKPFNQKIGTDEIHYAKETTEGSIIAVGNSHELNFQSNTYFLKYLKGEDMPIVNEVYTNISATTPDMGEYVTETSENYIIGGYYDTYSNNSNVFLLKINKMSGDIEQNGFISFSDAGQINVANFLHVNNNILTIGGYTNSDLYGSNGKFHPLLLFYNLNNGDQNHKLYGRADISVDVNTLPSFQYIENCGYIISTATENENIYLIRTDREGNTIGECQ